MGIRAIRYALYGLVVLAAVAVGVGVRFLVQKAAEPIPHSVQTPKQGPGPASSPDVPRKEEPGSAPSANDSGAVEEPKVGAVVPSFDVVRVEPDGQSVIAGRVPPSSEVELLENGRVLDRATANEAGEVVFTPPALGVGNHDLTLRARSADGTVLLSKQSVLVRVPQKGQGDLLVVAGEAGKPSKVLQAGPSALQPAETAKAETAAEPEVTKAVAEPQPLRIGAVETGDGRLFVQGTGPAGAKLAIYLNDTQLAEATVGADGHWTLTVRKGLAPGDYKVRADQLDSDRTVTARAEVPFAYTAQAGAQAAASAEGAKAADQQTAETGHEASPSAAAQAAQPEGTAPAQSPSEAAKAEEAESASPDAKVAEAPAGTPAGEPADEANPVVANIGTVSVKRGDSLWRISRSTYGKGIQYTVIYEANEKQIRDPDLIYPGQIFVLPSRG